MILSILVKFWVKFWITLPSRCRGLFIVFSSVCDLVKLYFLVERVFRVQNIGDGWPSLHKSKQAELVIGGDERVNMLGWSLLEGMDTLDVLGQRVREDTWSPLSKWANAYWSDFMLMSGLGQSKINFFLKFFRFYLLWTNFLNWNKTFKFYETSISLM